MQKSTHGDRLTDILPVTLGSHKPNFKREGNARSRIWVQTCPFKSCQPESNRGKECSGALTKPDAPAYSPLCAHALSSLLSLLQHLLNAADGPRNWAGSLLSPSEARPPPYPLRLMWPGFWLSVCAPISLSSCLLLFAFLSLFLADLFLNLLHPTILPCSVTGTCTHAHTHEERERPAWDYSTPSPVHPLRAALPVPCINGP